MEKRSLNQHSTDSDQTGQSSTTDLVSPVGGLGFDSTGRGAVAGWLWNTGGSDWRNSGSRGGWSRGSFNGGAWSLDLTIINLRDGGCSHSDGSRSDS